MLKAYKYRIYPNKEQQVLLAKHFGCVRFVYNWALALKTTIYQQTQKSISRFDLQAMLPQMKKGDYPWLSEVNSLTLQATLENLDKAYTKFFREKKGYPKFKSKKSNRFSFSVPQQTKIDFVSSKVSIPKVFNIKAKLHRAFDGKIKTSTVTKTPSGKYYISVLVETNDVILEKKAISEKQAIAFDLGIKSFLVASNGNVINNPKFLKKSLKKLKRVQRWHSRKVKGSSNRGKHRIVLARLYERVSNQRKDWLHKLSSKYIKSDYNTFCFEDLNVKGLVKNHKLAQAINDVSWSSFVSYLSYKSDWYGKNILTIGRFEPSSKLCSNCGNIHKELALKDRTFKCPSCDFTIDRDYQASLNILRFAFGEQNLVSMKLQKIGQELSKSKKTPVKNKSDFSNKASSLKQEAPMPLGSV